MLLCVVDTVVAPSLTVVQLLLLLLLLSLLHCRPTNAHTSLE